MNDAEGPDVTADERSFRRAAQYVPLTIGGLEPAHRVVSPWIRAWRRNATLLLTAAALVLAAAGVLVSVAPRTVSVYADASHVYVGNVTLTRATSSPVVGYMMYGGSAVVLLSSAHPVDRAAGAATLGGVHVSGTCSRAAQTATLSERCTFTVGGARETSTDVFDSQSRVWRRTYSDRETVAFAVPAVQTVIPIPLPLGR
jgi:hypothetical protein